MIAIGSFFRRQYSCHYNVGGIWTRTRITRMTAPGNKSPKRHYVADFWVQVSSQRSQESVDTVYTPLPGHFNSHL